jgi:hypothetical protein
MFCGCRWDILCTSLLNAETLDAGTGFVDGVDIMSASPLRLTPLAPPMFLSLLSVTGHQMWSWPVLDDEASSHRPLASPAPVKQGSLLQHLHPAAVFPLHYHSLHPLSLYTRPGLFLDHLAPSLCPRSTHIASSPYHRPPAPDPFSPCRTSLLHVRPSYTRRLCHAHGTLHYPSPCPTLVHPGLPSFSSDSVPAPCPLLSDLPHPLLSSLVLIFLALQMMQHPLEHERVRR